MILENPADVPVLVGARLALGAVRFHRELFGRAERLAIE
jgi:hypothetical protein